MSTKEEQKQHLIDIMKGDEELGLYEHGQEVGHSDQVEELEEAALKWFMTANKHEIIFDLGWIKIFEAGAKWQAQRLYSEEQVIKLIQFLSMDKDFNGYGSVYKATASYFLEKFKKQ